MGAMAKPAVIGIDLGSSESYVAYVGKGIVDVVQNEVSKRATSALVGFTDRERLLGDAALAQIRSNAKNSCRNFKHLLGRKCDASDIEIEHFWSTCPLVPTSDGYTGYDVTYKGERRQYTATQVTAMFLTKLREVTEKWCQAKVADVVIAAPAGFTDFQRQALLDAAQIAGLSVLRIMNEHTATALAYGIYRSNDFDPEKPMNVVFCSMGHSLFSVSIVQFVRGKLTVLCERSDKVGGREMDECLMREFAAQFQKKHGCDPLSNKKSAFKLEDAVSKTKKILSANAEAPVNVECLMEDFDFSSTMTRDDLEKMCEPAMKRVKAVLDAAVEACGLPIEEIDSVEVVGGGSRVPWVKKLCSAAFGGKECSTTMNQEESVARGCALQAAILSPLYKVRDFKVEDCHPYPINIGWLGAAADSEAPKEDDGDTQMVAGDGEYKTACVFPAKSLMNVSKLLTFFRAGPFDVKAEFGSGVPLPVGQPKELGTWRVELPPQPEPKKVKVTAKLSLHGTFTIEGAQMVEVEEYEETIKEKRELPASPEPEGQETKEGEAPETNGKEAEKAAEDGDAPMPDQEAGEKKEEPVKEKPAKEPKFEWVDVVKKKKRTKRTDLIVTESGRPGLPAPVLQKQTDEEFVIQAEMRDILETDEKRNDLESYILNTRDKIAESGEWGAFISSTDRETYSAELTKGEDWLYDNPDATKAQLVEKLDELKVVGDVVAWRFKESTMRDEWISAVTGTIKNYRAAAETPGDKYGHISAEKLGKIITACAELEQWLNETKAKQESVAKHEKPVLICADMEKKNQELAKMSDDILKEPKPAPPKEPKKPKASGDEVPEPEAAPEAEASEEKSPSPAKEQKTPEETADGPENMDVD